MAAVLQMVSTAQQMEPMVVLENELVTPVDLVKILMELELQEPAKVLQEPMPLQTISPSTLVEIMEEHLELQMELSLVVLTEPPIPLDLLEEIHMELLERELLAMERLELLELLELELLNIPLPRRITTDQRKIPLGLLPPAPKELQLLIPIELTEDPMLTPLAQIGLAAQPTIMALTDPLVGLELLELGLVQWVPMP